MRAPQDLVNDPGFRSLLRRRARWRWGMSISLIGAYLVWGVAGIYLPALYSAPFPGSVVPWGMAVGILIIIMSIVASIVYVKVVNRIEADELASQGSGE
jgi:uncharacterized membrane protein (DUF485 family)